jgi:hypothetical protein
MPEKSAVIMERVFIQYVEREPQQFFYAVEVGWYRELTRPYTLGRVF